MNKKEACPRGLWAGGERRRTQKGGCVAGGRPCRYV